MRRTMKEIEADLEALNKEATALQAKEKQDRIEALTARLKATADQMQHDQRAADYVRFMESKRYVDSLKASIEQNGLEATTATGEKFSLLFASGTNTAKTFAVLPLGSTVELKGILHLVDDFQHSFGGSTATLLPLSQKFLISDEKATPYSGRPCHFNRNKGLLTVAKKDRLQPSQAVIVDGVKFIPTHVVGSDSHCVRYQLEATE